MYRPLVEWINKRLETKDPVKATDLADEAIDRFRKDTHFLQHEFRTFLLAEIRAILAITRHGPINLPNRLGVTPETTNSSVLNDPIVVRWREQTSRGHMLLTEMNRKDLTEAIGYRRHQHSALGRRLLFLESLRRGLANETQTVGERFEPEQLEAMRRRYEHGTGAIDDNIIAQKKNTGKK